MRKKVFIGMIALLFVGLGIFLFLHNKVKYKIVASKIDNNSPDVMLKIYYEEKEIEIDKIYYLDNILLCTNENLTVNKFDLNNEKELYLLLKDGSKVKAKVVVEE